MVAIYISIKILIILLFLLFFEYIFCFATRLPFFFFFAYILLFSQRIYLNSNTYNLTLMTIINNFILFLVSSSHLLILENSKYQKAV